MTSKELRTQRADLIMKAKAIVNLDGATDEQLAQAEAMHAEADKIAARVAMIERSDNLSAELNAAFAAQAEREPAAARAAMSHDPAEARKVVVDRDNRLLRAYLGGNIRSLSEEDRAAFQAGMNRSIQATTNGQTVGTNAQGGFTVAPEWANELLIAMKAFGGMRAVSRNIQTATGASLPFVTMDDTSQTGSLVAAEGTQITADTDLNFAQVSINAWTYKSGLMTVSVQLLQDSAFDIGSVVRDAMATRLARIQNTHFTVGTGSSQPQGVVVGAASGAVGATGQTLTVIFDDFMNLEHSIDPAYRGPDCRWMMHDSTFKAVKKLKDTQNRPLFMPGYDVGAPDSILGYPVAINQDVAVMAANAKSILFGNFSNYVVRDVLDVQMVVLRERFMDSLLVGYIAFQRTDGKLISAAQPIKYYANSAT